MARAAAVTPQQATYRHPSFERHRLERGQRSADLLGSGAQFRSLGFRLRFWCGRLVGVGRGFIRRRGCVRDVTLRHVRDLAQAGPTTLLRSLLGTPQPGQVLVVIPAGSRTVPIRPQERREVCRVGLARGDSAVEGAVKLEQSFNFGHIRHLSQRPPRQASCAYDTAHPACDVGRKHRCDVVNGDEDPGATTRPGPFLFDPVLGATLFNEIQAEGLRAAGALVERLVHLVDGSPATTASDRAADSADQPASPTDATGPEMGAILPWFELWRDVG